jgi:hypothetical protein
MKRNLTTIRVAALGFAIGSLAGSAYLLLGGEYLFTVPRWAEITFYPGFLAGFKAYDLVHSQSLAQVIGVTAVGASYGLIGIVCQKLWFRLRRKLR